MSTFRVDVIRVKLHPHENADSLSIVKFEGYQVVVRTEDWKDGDLAAYIPPDSVVPDAPEYAFLEGKFRITARRFRKEWSFGLLMPAPEGSQEGDDVAELMKITHYEPVPKFSNNKTSKGFSDTSPPPPEPGVFYDIENWQRYPDVFQDGEEVWITEKIHGTNFRATFQEGKLFVSSRNFWRLEWISKKPRNLLKRLYRWALRRPEPMVYAGSVYWKALREEPDLVEWLETHPGLIVYGEIYGEVQSGFPYDSTQAKPYRIRLFDIYYGERFLSPETAKELLGPWLFPRLWVPIDYIGPYSKEAVENVRSLPSKLAKHIREGCVIRPAHERYNPKLGRVILKSVNPKYLEKS